MFFFQGENRSDREALFLPLCISSFLSPFLRQIWIYSVGWVVTCCFDFFFFFSRGCWVELGRGFGGHHLKLRRWDRKTCLNALSYGRHSHILSAKMPLFSFPVDAAKMPSGVGVSLVLNIKNSTYHLIWVAWDMGVWRVCVWWGKVEKGKEAA